MDYGRFLKITSLTVPNSLRRLLLNRGGELEVAAQRLFDTLIGAGCRTVVQELEYIDSDFRASHKRFYYLHYKDTPRRCTRLHFFASDVTGDDLHTLPESIADKYLGYTVIRPLPAHPLGTTILHEDVAQRMFGRMYPTEERHIPCSAPQIVNLAGNEIQFRGIPWMQQDKLVAACASTAIWTANRHLSDRFPRDFKRHSTAQITDLATRFNPATGRGMPSDGLTAEQMVLALRSMGYEPLYWELDSADEAALIASQYIRSSIPVIAVVMHADGGHAVTLVGHTLSASPSRAPKSTVVGQHKANIYNSSDFFPRYIMQDDSGGPLRFLEFLTWDQAVKQKEVSQKDREDLERRFPCVARIDDRMGSRKEIAYLTSLIIPVPLRVTLKATQAHRNAVELAKDFLLRDGIGADDDLVFDTYLRPSNDYKKWWSPLANRASDVAPLIRRHLLPHWIWITEFGAVDQWGKKGPVIGHIVQDSSGRGTRQVLDDLIGLIAPDQLALALPDGTFIRSPRTESLTISRFGEGQAI